jgi:hypothetical protein
MPRTDFGLFGLSLSSESTKSLKFSTYCVKPTSSLILLYESPPKLIVKLSSEY